MQSLLLYAELDLLDDRLNGPMMQLWAQWLPKDALPTLKYAGSCAVCCSLCFIAFSALGYYTARVRPGLRVVSLNSNY